MDIRYKRLTEKELNTFIHMRINQLREEGAKEEIDLVPALKDYYTRHMADGTFVSWLALDGKNIIGIKEGQMAAFRREHLGFVFQDFNLLDTFSLKDNIFLPLVLSGTHHKEMMARLTPIANTLGISELLEKFPYEVSGGQKQRAAVARALITNPELILADEPTGALDSKSTDQLLDLFTTINESGQTIVMVTHSTKAASHANRVLFIKDGEVFHQLYKGSMSNEEMFEKISHSLTVMTTGGRTHE